MPFAANEGARIYWDEAGKGAALLFIMGLGFTSDVWFRARPAFADAYRTIALDNRGVGRSDLTPGPYTIALMAADAAAVLDAAAVESAHLFGVSMGGMIAQEFALRYPARVRSLVLGCTSPRGPAAIPAEEAALQLLFTRAQMTPEEAAQASLPFIYDSGTPPERIEEDLAVRRPWFPTAEAYLAQLQAILAWECSSRLEQIHAPTLVIHGENDRLVPAGNARLLAENIRDAKLVLIPHASHIFWTDQPELSRQAIREFLDAQE